MVAKWEKFINKHPLRKDLEDIITDIRDNNLDSYYIKPVKGYDQYFRIRKGKIRIIFQKSETDNLIIAIDTRWHIYRGLKW